MLLKGVIPKYKNLIMISTDKRKFDDTKIEIPGEYNKFEYISKINKKN